MYFSTTIKGMTLKLLQLKVDFFVKFLVDVTDVPNYNNLPSNIEKLSLPFKRASYTVALALVKQCRSIR